MNRFSVPPEMVSFFCQLNESMDLRDAAGNLIGIFTPHKEQPRAESAALAFDLEEAERVLEESRHLPGLALEQIWRKLGHVRSTVVVKAALSELVGPFTEVVEIRNSDGLLLGYFKPRAEVDADLNYRAKEPVDPHELERTATTDHPQGVPLEEALPRLESME